MILLDRSRKPVAMTEAGSIIVEQARKTLTAYDNIHESVSTLRGEKTGRLRLGVIPTISPYILHKFIPTFVKRYPKVELETRDMVTADIIEALARDQIDAAIVAGGTCGEGVDEYNLFDDTFYAYVSPNHPLFDHKNIAIKEIDMQDLVILSSGNCMRDQVMELCQAKQATPSSHYTFISGSIDSLVRLVDCTPNLTIIPQISLDYIPRRHHTRIKTLEKGNASRKISVVVRKTYVKSSIIKALNETILECCTPKV